MLQADGVADCATIAKAPTLQRSGSDAPTEVSVRHKWTFAAAFLGAWGPLSVWNTHRTTLFVIYFQADVAAMGAIQTVAALVDAFNGPFVAQIADTAFINRRLPKLFPLHLWGRRAPLMALGAPLMLAGPTLMWLVPSRERWVTTFWFALCFALFVNGTTITLQSYLASIQELFGTGTSRARAIVRQTPFMVITYALAGAPVLIAFTTNPDMGGRCCATRGFDCTASVPCGCFASAASIHDGTRSNHSTLYAPPYVDACALGPLPATNATTVSDVAAGRALACSIPAIPYGRFGICAGITVFLGMCLYLAVPPARAAAQLKSETLAQERGDAEDAPALALAPAAAAATSDAPTISRLPNSSGVFSALCLTLRARAFQVYACMMLLSTTWGNFFGAFLNLYFVYVAGIEPEQIGSISIALAGTNLGFRIMTIPIFQSVGIIPAAVIAGALTGVLNAPFDMCQHQLIGWAIDEDAIANGGRRREGMHYAANGMVQHLSGAILGLVLIGWGAAGFDAQLCVHEQSRASVSAIEYSFLVGLPIVSLLTAAFALCYPIQGERLRKLKEHMEGADVAPREVVAEALPLDMAASASMGTYVDTALLEDTAPAPAPASAPVPAGSPSA